MYQRWLYTIATAVSLTGVYALYSVAMQSIVVIPIRPEQPATAEDYNEAQRPAENVRVALTHIPMPYRQWAAKSKYMLHAEQAFIYTEHWQPVLENNKRIRFDKFAMVWITIDKEGLEQAVSIVSDHALLEFASAFDEKTPTPGRVVRAMLEGDVKISGPDGLSVEGHNFIFDEAELKLYTLYPVNFHFQAHTGSASRMEMRLIPAEGLPGKDRPHVYGVESIHLTANPRLTENQYVLLEVQMPQGDELKPINVKCSGELEYTVQTNTAVLTDNVRVWTGPTEKIDRLDCYKLTMQFIPKRSTADPSTADTSSKSDEQKRREKEYQQIERDLEFSWLMAESQFEAVQRHGPMVRIDSKSQAITASMGRLTYNAETRTLSMTSEEPQQSYVSVVQNHSELTVPSIEAQLGDSSESQLSLTSLICHGAGRLTYVDEKTGKLVFRATWQKQLTKKTDPETNLDLISLEENAQLRQPDQVTGLIADSIKIWLVPFALSSPIRRDDQSAETPQPEPKRMLAQRNVGLQSPQLLIKRTNELDIRFEETDKSKTTTSRQKLRSKLQPVSLTRLESQPVGFASVPAAGERSLWPPAEIPSRPDAASSSRKTAKPLTNPIIVSADRIGVRLRRIPDQQEPELLAVHSEGKVNISLDRTPGEKPTTLQGDQVDLKRQSVNREVVDVFGSPALIRDPKFRIEGKEIHLDRGENCAWVDGAGRLQITIPETASFRGLEGVSNRDLHVRWDESMIFDGLNAKFIGRVEAKLGLASMECEQMNLTLVDRLAFQSVTVDTQPAVQTIHCVENVKFKNSTYNKTRLIDKYRGEVGQFTWNHSTGEVIAQGPGEIQVWRLQTSSASPLAPRDTIQANRPIPVEITEWDYTRIQFEGKLKGRVSGNLNGASDEQSATIEDRVKVTHGPVRSPNDEVNPDELPSKAGTIHCDRLEFVNYPVSKKNPVEYRQLFGLGNAEAEGQVDGRRFTASADEISFDGSKGLFVLRGHGKQNASLTEIGSGSIPGRRIEFNPTTKYLKVERATGGQWSPAR